MLSEWEKYDIEQRIVAILREAPARTPGHHFGRPFLTAYQLAIEFNHRHPEVAAALHMQVGGAGIGVRTSLAQYLSGQLSQRIKAGKITAIEGALLSD